MEGKGSSCAPGAPCVKEENGREQDGPPELTDQIRIPELTIEVVKEEPPCEGDGREDALTSLYSDHEVKEDIVLGPESLQRSNVVLHAGTIWPHGPLRECSVRLERLPDITALSQPAHTATNNTCSPEHDNTRNENLPDRKTIRDIINSLFEEDLEDTDVSVTRDAKDSGDSHGVANNVIEKARAIRNSGKQPQFEEDIEDARTRDIITDTEAFNVTNVEIEKAHFRNNEKQLQFEEDIENTSRTRDIVTNAKDSDFIEKAQFRKSEKQLNVVKSDDFCANFNRRFAPKSQLMKHLLSHIHIPTKVDYKAGYDVTSVENYSGNDVADNVTVSASESDCGAPASVRGTQVKQEIHKQKPLREKSHICEICNKKFSALSVLKKHIETHRTLRPHCEVCNKKFRNLDNLKIHTRIHTGEKPFSCDICGIKFRLLRVLDTHRLTHTGDRPHQCPICQKMFRQRHALSRHKQRHSRNVHSCETCGKKIPKSDVKVHKRFHMSENNYPCEICEKGFMTLSHLKEHLMTHAAERPLSCEICKKTFKLRVSLKRHVRIIHKKELSGSLKLRRRKQLKEHISSNAGLDPNSRLNGLSSDIPTSEVHEAGRDTASVERDAGDIADGVELDEPVVAPELGSKDATVNEVTLAVDGACESAFENQPAASARETQSEKEKATYSCAVCKKRFNKFVTLKEHTRIHTGENPFSCEICGKAFGKRKALDDHKLIHTGDRPFQCQICEKRFRQKTSFRRHKLTHSQAMHSCEICGKELRKSDVKGHELFHLSGNKNRCEICDKGFKCMKNLKDHLLIHSGQKPLSCKICKKSFRHRASLMRHEGLHTGKQQFTSKLLKIHIKKQLQEELSCNVCKLKFTEVKYLKIHKRKHMREKSRSCEICNKELSSMSKLRKHLLIHQRQKPYCCEICNKQFRDSHSLTNHKRVHTEEKPFSCDICKVNFKHQSTQNKHKRLHAGKLVVCTDPRKFPCDMCEKVFPNRPRLKRHKEEHKGSHTCQICGKTIPKADIKTHERFHTGDKRYSCEMMIVKKDVNRNVNTETERYSESPVPSSGARARHKNIHAKKYVDRNVNIQTERDSELPVPSSGARAMSPKSLFLELIRKKSEQLP